MTKITSTLLILLMASGCGGKKNDEPDECPGFDPWQVGDEGADISSPPPAGEVRAGRITSEDDIPPGVKNKAAVGDFMLRNGRVVFVIDDGDNAEGYNPFGGKIVHADLVDDDGEPMGRNLFGESFHGLSLRLIDPDSVTVLSDGSDGGEAVVRIVGEVRNMPLLDVAFGVIFAVNDGVTYIADYALGPDDEYLEVRYHIRNPLTNIAYVNLFIFGSVQGDGIWLFTPEYGFDDDELNGRHAMYGHVGDGISYGWVDAEGRDLRYVIEESKLLFGDKGINPGIDACSEETFPVIRLLVADGGAESLLAAKRRMDGEAEPDPTTFSVSVTGGADASSARVHVTDTEGAYVTSVISRGGAWTAGLADGSYLATAVLDGHPVLRDVPFTAGSGVDLEIPQAAVVSYTVEDDAGDPVPAKIMFFPAAPPDPLPASFGEKTYPGAAATFLYDPWAAGSLNLPPGEYTVIAARGFEYEIDEQTFTADTGAETGLTLVLDHSVDSTALMCGDFHVHSEPSPDSSDTRADKVHSAAAEGLEILVSTDHEVTADFQPDIEAEGLQAWLHGVPGEELTTFAYGHFNVYPQTVRSDAPNGGAIDWYYRPAADVFDEAHADPLDPVLQVNHPRSSTAMMGYFVAAGFDPDEGTVSNPDVWYTDFQALEVFNDDTFRDQEEASVRDWFALVDMGLRFAAMGNSDTHDLIWTETGFPRSCLDVGHDDPEALTNVEVRDTVKAMKVFVSGGILVTGYASTGEGPGDVLDAPSGTADIDVMVQAPTWMSADRLRVFVSGVETDTITLDSSTSVPSNPVIRYQDTITVATDGGDGWVVFEAEGDTTMNPVVMDQMPFGVTNPIYLDGDGDGVFTPPRSLPPVD